MTKLAEILQSIMPLLDKAKEFVEKEAGFQRRNLALAEVSESKDGERWLITFFYNLPGQETYCEIEVSKRNAEMSGFKRFECDEVLEITKPPRVTPPN